MRKLVLGVLIVIGSAGALILLFAGIPRRGFEIESYFQDIQGLRDGAPVRLAGVEIGTVKKVQIRPERRDAPAEVTMSIQTPYELKIPNDAIVSVSSAGVFGPSFADIDIRSTSGPPVQRGGVLKSRQSEDMTQAILQKLTDALKGCNAKFADPAAEKKMSK